METTAFKSDQKRKEEERERARVAAEGGDQKAQDDAAAKVDAQSQPVTAQGPATGDPTYDASKPKGENSPVTRPLYDALGNPYSNPTQTDYFNQLSSDTISRNSPTALSQASVQQDNAISDANDTLDKLKQGTNITRDAPQATGAPPVISGFTAAQKPTAVLAATPGNVTPQTVTASTIAPTAGASAVNAQAAKLEADQQAAIRAKQLGLLTSLEGAAAGTNGPTAAEILGQKQAQDAASQQLGLVGMNHGRGQGGALRTAGQNISKIQSDAAMNAGILRAQEQQQARAQLLQGLEGTRGQDIGVATTEAGFQQGANLQNAAKGTDVNLTNAQIAANRATEQARLNTGASTTTAQLDLEGQKSNQDTATKVNLANAGNQTQTNIVGATEANKVGMANAELDLRGQINNADNATKVALANAGFTLEGRQIDDARNIAAVRAMLDAQGQVLTSADQRTKNALLKQQLDDAVKRGDKDRTYQLIGGIISGGVAIGAAALGAPEAAPIAAAVTKEGVDAISSDRRMKTHIVDLYSDEKGKTDKRALLDAYDGKDEVGEMLDKLKPVSFKYKNPEAEGAAPGQRFGVIAQDLEKSPMGKSIVVQMPDGHKGIDVPQAVGVMLAALARMRQQGKRA